MSFTLQQRKDAYSKLSPEMQDFVMASETTEFISKILASYGLNEDESNTADSEILYALLKLQDLSSSIQNISSQTGRSVESLSGLKANLQKNIFDKIALGTTELWKITESVRSEPSPSQPEVRNKIGESFEQTIVNQAKAMQPVRAEAPNNLPTEQAVMPQNPVSTSAPAPSGESKAIHDYKPGGDPYREQI